MPLLFSYGTLRDQAVQQSIFGRTLVGHPDCILGYRLETAPVRDADFAKESGRLHHAILRRAPDGAMPVAGTVLEVTDKELLLTDAYEPVGYVRVLAQLESGGQAWVYVEQASPHLPDVAE